jgi:predicted metal-dependent enzyme (double-stranded beta helix superfamily)
VSCSGRAVSEGVTSDYTRRRKEDANERNEDSAGSRQRWQKIGALMPMLTASKALQESAKAWPVPGPEAKRPQNLLFYEDPDYGFVINGLIKAPRSGTPVHDHAHTWTVYAVLEGEEHVVRYRKTNAGKDTAELEKTDDYIVGNGYVDVVPPGVIHAEYAGDARTVAVIVRSERVGGFLQGMFDPATGKMSQAPGPEQVPYRL